MLTILWLKMAFTLSRLARLDCVELLRREVLETHQLSQNAYGKL
jgi:hypothetical protein